MSERVAHTLGSALARVIALVVGVALAVALSLVAAAIVAVAALALAGVLAGVAWRTRGRKAPGPALLDARKTADGWVVESARPGAA
jgi:hypothetical protein